jgi:peptidoglycan/xylan/chitin deacetylase (PgdA/CDA1 family)
LPIVFALLALTLCCASPAFASWNGGHDVLGAAEAGKAWYFAEGTTRAGFSEYICLFNPGERVAVTSLSYMLGTGENVERRYDLLPRTRATVDVSAQVPPGNDVSVEVTSSEPVVAERSMYFDYKGACSGGHASPGAASPQKTWYFAEGCTRPGYDTYLCVQNPDVRDAMIELKYFRSGVDPEVRKDVKVPARSRFTIPVHEEPLGIGRYDDGRGDVAIEVRSTNGVPVLVERPMYFNRGPYLDGGHDVVGAAGPAEAWYFAEGCSRDGFDTYICLANPGRMRAVVSVHYYCGDGRTETRRNIEVEPESRFTIAAHEDELGAGRRNDAGGDFSIKVESENGVPVVAERPVYFMYRPFWSGGHDVVGAQKPETEWYFAEGCTRMGFETYLCMQNPGRGDALVDIAYFMGDGTINEKHGVRVAGGSRFTVPVHDPALGVGRYDDSSGDVSIRVESTNGVGVIAERSMYFADRWRTIDKAALADAWGWGELSRTSPARNDVALTFDIEGSSAIVSRLLDILKSRGVRATFFTLGPLAASAPDLMRRIVAEGHEIASHSMSHPMFTRLSPWQVESELSRTEAVISQATGLGPKPYFRFPYGDRNGGLISQVNSLGYFSVYWSVDPQDWSGNSVDTIQAIVMANTRNGSIILMHDRDKTVAALPSVIDGLRARGFDMVPLTEALFPGP